MRSYSRILSLLLALLLTGSAAAGCADEIPETQPESTPVEEASSAAPEETDEYNTRANVRDNLPEGLDYAGTTFTIYVANDAGQCDYMAGPEEQTGDIVPDTVMSRNLAVEERLNINLEYIPDASSAWNTVAKNINTYLLAGDTTFDLYLGQQYGIVSLITGGGFYNTNLLEHIDFSQPWWNTNYMDAISIGQDTRYFLVGDYFISAMQYTHVLYFNKAMYTNLYGDCNSVYEEVLEGTWTLDRLSELASGAFVDVNNNGETDEEDQLGYVTNQAHASVDPFMYLADIPYSSHDEEGNLTLNLMDERILTLLDKTIAFFHQPGSDYLTDTASNTIFMNGTSLFMGINTLNSAAGLRDMKDDYGFLPYPKLTADQENYRALVADIVLLGAIPVTTQNLDKAGAILEALSSETYRTLVPAWYETALKVKYSRDDISARIIDIVHDAMTTDFIYAYSPQLMNLGTIMRTQVNNNNNTYTSEIARLEKALNKMLNKLIEAYNENN